MKVSDPKIMTLSNESQPSVSEDVLHFDNQSKLTPEEVAKAVAHHNRRHGEEDNTQKKSAKTSPAKKNR